MNSRLIPFNHVFHVGVLPLHDHFILCMCDLPQRPYKSCPSDKHNFLLFLTVSLLENFSLFQSAKALDYCDWLRTHIALVYCSCLSTMNCSRNPFQLVVATKASHTRSKFSNGRNQTINTDLSRPESSI